MYLAQFWRCWCSTVQQKSILRNQFHCICELLSRNQLLHDILLNYASGWPWEIKPWFLKNQGKKCTVLSFNFSFALWVTTNTDPSVQNRFSYFIFLKFGNNVVCFIKQIKAEIYEKKIKIVRQIANLEILIKSLGWDLRSILITSIKNQERVRLAEEIFLV